MTLFNLILLLEQVELVGAFQATARKDHLIVYFYTLSHLSV